MFAAGQGFEFLQRNKIISFTEKAIWNASPGIMKFKLSYFLTSFLLKTYMSVANFTVFLSKVKNFRLSHEKPVPEAECDSLVSKA